MELEVEVAEHRGGSSYGVWRVKRHSLERASSSAGPASNLRRNPTKTRLGLGRWIDCNVL
jgi:hypothetical protein